MTTTTTPSKLPSLPTGTAPDEIPEVVEARAHRDILAKRLAILDVELRRYELVLDPHAEVTATEDDVLDARENLTAVRVRHAQASRALRQAEKAWQSAREAARETARAAFHERKRELIARLDEALSQQAAPVNAELLRVEDEERRLTGDWHVSGWSWPELADPTSRQQSRLADWRARAMEARLL